MFRVTTSLFILSLITAALTAPNSDLGWRIVGGRTANEGQFPWTVSMRRSGRHSCGGSVISENVILTAAHCVSSAIPSILQVVAGTNKLDQGGDTYDVEQIIIHENYNSHENINDVALLILKTSIVMSDKVKIIELRQEDRDIEEDCVLSGWGRTSYPGDIPNDLQWIPLKTTTRQQCYKTWISIQEVYDNQTCTLTKSGEGACHGDSGGALVDLNLKQIGIVSWGRPCAIGMPDVFTRVPSYVDWIKKNANLN